MVILDGSFFGIRRVPTDVELTVTDQPQADKFRLQLMEVNEHLIDFRQALLARQQQLSQTGFPGGVVRTVQGRVLRIKRPVWPIGPSYNWLHGAKPGELYCKMTDRKYRWQTRIVPSTPAELRYQALHGHDYGVDLADMAFWLRQQADQL